MYKKIFIALLLFAGIGISAISQTQKYDFILKFNSYQQLKNDGSFSDRIIKQSTLSISKNKKGCIEFGDNKFEFEYISLEKYDQNYGVLVIQLDEKYVIEVAKNPGWAAVNMQNKFPYIRLLELSNLEVLDSIFKFVTQSKK